MIIYAFNGGRLQFVHHAVTYAFHWHRDDNEETILGDPDT